MVVMKLGKKLIQYYISSSLSSQEYVEAGTAVVSEFANAKQRVGRNTIRNG